MKCKFCGSDLFYGHQVCHMDILVDEDENYYDGVHEDLCYDIYDSNAPFGPFQCCGCGAEYDELTDGEPFSEPIKGWKPRFGRDVSTNEYEITIRVYTLQDTVSVYATSVQEAVDKARDTYGRGNEIVCVKQIMTNWE